MSNQNSNHPTSEPFTDPKQGQEGARQSAIKMVSLPLAAAGGVVSEVVTKAKEFVTGTSTKIDTSSSSESHGRKSSAGSSDSAITSSSEGSTSA
ncbi:hypothetical protein BG004_007669 [Podila humilis]|nr:hypothetical protein BG004_007669 [Podila humilis]